MPLWRIRLVRQLVVSIPSKSIIDKTEGIEAYYCPYPDDQARQDAVYNSTEGLWACCGVDADGDVTCNDPLKEFFAAPAPASMSSTFSVGALITAAASSSTSTSTFSTVQTTSSGAITTTSPATRKEASQTTAVPQIAATSQVTSSPTSLAVHTQKGLSTGAIAGIGIGCAIAGIAIIGSIIFLLKRCYRKTASNQDQILGDHRRNQRPIVSDQKSSAVTCANPSYRPTEMSLPSVYEGETRRQSKPRELEGAEYASEMGGSEQWSARERVVELPWFQRTTLAFWE